MRNKLIVLLALCLSVSACTDAKHDAGSGKAVINSTAIKNDQSLSAADKAEKLALAAEQLVSLTGFMYANEVADQALAMDANNKRAQLVKALVGPAMALKGVYKRIKPLATRNAEEAAKYSQTMKVLAQQPNGSLKTFLVSGPEDIQSEKDVQNFIAHMNSKINDLRVFLKNNKDMTITLNTPEASRDSALENAYDDCYWTSVEEGVYEYECDVQNVLQVKVAGADVQVIQHMVAGYQLYFNLMNAYSYDGAIAVSDKYKNSGASSAIIRSELMKNPTFATLRDAKSLQAITAMGMDAVAGVRYASKMQSELCREGYHTPENRPGFVFSDGICVDKVNKDGEPLEAVLASIELVLTGGLVDMTFGREYTGNTYETTVKPAAILLNPVQDVRSLGLIFDKCDNVMAAKDSTLGGIFVNQDANAALSVNKPYCYKGETY